MLDLEVQLEEGCSSVGDKVVVIGLGPGGRLWACLIIFLLVATGCSRSANEAPKVASETVSLAEVEAAVDKTRSTSGEFDEKSRIALGSVGTLETLLTGEFAATSGNYRVAQEFSASSVELEQLLVGQSGVSMADLRADLLRVGDSLFLTMKGWPARLQGRWLRFTMADAASALGREGVEFSGDARTPSKLLYLVKSADQQVTKSAGSAGATSYRLTVPADAAVSALGTQVHRLFARQQIDSGQLKGRFPVDVTVDMEGRVQSIHLDTSDLLRQLFQLAKVDVPGDVRGSVDDRFLSYGKPVSIVAPGADKIIDPSEMGR